MPMYSLIGERWYRRHWMSAQFHVPDTERKHFDPYCISPRSHLERRAGEPSAAFVLEYGMEFPAATWHAERTVSICRDRYKKYRDRGDCYWSSIGFIMLLESFLGLDWFKDDLESLYYCEGIATFGGYGMWHGFVLWNGKVYELSRLPTENVRYFGIPFWWKWRRDLKLIAPIFRNWNENRGAAETYVQDVLPQRSIFI